MSAAPVPTSISLDEARSHRWEALVIGAGPAGSAAAVVLARQGRRVLVVDRATFPRDKACGCCLAPAAVQVLGELGAGDLLDHHGAGHMRRLDLWMAGRRLEIPVSAGRICSRRALDAALLCEAIADGAAFLPDCIARVGRAEDRTRVVRLRCGEDAAEVRVPVVIAAGGLGFPINAPAPDAARAERRWSRSHLGGAVIVAARGLDLPAQTVRMIVAERGYVGFARVEDGRVAVGGAFDAAHVRECGGLGPAAAQMLEEAGQDVPGEIGEARWLAVPHLTRRPLHPASQRVLAAGDAAGFVEPFTGEGITWAIRTGVSAALLAERVLRRRGAPWSGAVEREWGRTHRRLVRTQQARCRLIAEALRHPGVRYACMVLGDWAPTLARRLIHSMQAPDAIIPGMGSGRGVAHRGGA